MPEYDFGKKPETRPPVSEQGGNKGGGETPSLDKATFGPETVKAAEIDRTRHENGPPPVEQRLK
jgi:hypothetical protein